MVETTVAIRLGMMMSEAVAEPAVTRIPIIVVGKSWMLVALITKSITIAAVALSLPSESS